MNYQYHKFFELNPSMQLSRQVVYRDAASSGNSAVSTSSNAPETFDPLEWNTKLQEGQITFDVFLEKLNALDIEYQVYPSQSNPNRVNIKYEYDGMPFIFNVDKSIINGTKPKPETPTAPTFNRDQLSGLSEDDIQKYFTANADGTYSLNNANIVRDFPETEYGVIDTPKKLKEAIAKKKEAENAGSSSGTENAGSSSGTEGAGNEPPESDFKTYNQMATYLFVHLKQDEDIKKLQFGNGLVYEQIAETVRDSHKDDYASVTKAQLKEEFIAEYNARVGNTNDTENSPTGSYIKDYNDLRNYFFGILPSDPAIKNLKFNSGFSYYDIAEDLCAKHKDDCTSFTKEQLKEEFIAEYNRRIAGSTTSEGTTYPSGYKDWNECWESIKNGEIYSMVASTIGNPELMSKYYETARNQLQSDLKDNFETLTKEQIKDELVKKVRELHKEYDGEPVDTGNDTDPVNAPSSDAPDTDTATYPSGYKTWYECWQSISSGEIFNAVADAIDNKPMMDKYYNTAKYELYDYLKDNFKTLTKEDIQYHLNARITSYIDTDEGKDIYGDVIEALGTMDEKLLYLYTGYIGYPLDIQADDNFNTNFSINKDGTIKCTDSKAQEAFNKLIAVIREWCGDDVVNLLGDNVLEQLVSAAWMQAANNSNNALDFGTVKFGTFMDNVIANIKANIKNLKDNPENIKLLNQTPASKLEGITTNLPNYKTSTMDNGEIVYLDKNGNIENYETRAKIEATKTELKKRLRAAYPYLSQSKIDQMLNNAFSDAISFIHKQGKAGDVNVCGMTVRIRNNNDVYMSDLVDLALRYFDIELRSSGNFAGSTVSDENSEAYYNTKAQEDSNAIAAQASRDAEARAKDENTKSAVTAMLDSFTAIVTTGNIGQDLFWSTDNINTNFSVNNDGTIKITDAKAQQAFNKIITIIEKNYSDAFNKLGEKVLKQLVGVAWMLAANNSTNSLDFGSVQFGTFMTSVIQNLEKILKSLSTNPELLEFYTGMPASKNGSLTNNLTHYNTNDTHGNDETIGYRSGGYVLGSDQKDLDETKADLKARIRNAYPHIDGAVLNSLVDQAFTDALKKLCAGGTMPSDWVANGWNSKKSQIHMDRLVDLALRYFDIELMNYIISNPGTTYKN